MAAIKHSVESQEQSTGYFELTAIGTCSVTYPSWKKTIKLDLWIYQDLLVTLKNDTDMNNTLYIILVVCFAL